MAFQGRLSRHFFGVATDPFQNNVLVMWMKRWSIGLIVLVSVAWASDDDQLFQHRIIQVLDNYCQECHEPGDSEGNIEFLDAYEARDIQKDRDEWRSVAAQLLNRTMPPPDEEQPSEEERMEVVKWVENFLRRTACDQGPYAGTVTSRRLNRLEYNLTVEDLFGLEFPFADSLPMESGGGEGFNNDGETLYLQPMLMERFIEAAGEIVDTAIVTPTQDLQFTGKDFIGAKDWIEPGNSVSVYAPVYLESAFRVKLGVKAPADTKGKVMFVVKVDERPAQSFSFPAGEAQGKEAERAIELSFTRGTHAITVLGRKGSVPFRVGRMRISQQERRWTDEQKAAHSRLLGVAPGEVPENEGEAADRVLRKFLPRAFRRPTDDSEIEKYLALYGRAADRGDPWEERIKLMVKGVLVSPDFLFRIESSPQTKEIEPIGEFELASRLSYFLWSTMPDDELMLLAAEGKLQDEDILTAQVNRMLKDRRSMTMANTFVGQWLGTKDVGGRIAPITNELQDTYTVEIASDMREEAVRLFHFLVTENRPVTELIDSDYTFMTGRLAKFLEIEGAKGLKTAEFSKFNYPDRNRGGLLGMAAVLAATSHYKETSPVLRGAWVFDTLVGSPVPPPPPNVPPLGGKKKDGKVLTTKERLELHRNDISCRSCHELIDPIGFGLENFDFLGRWRNEVDKHPIDAGGRMPTGEIFSNPAEMRKVLLETRKEQFLRQVSKKLLSYALGRGIDDQDDCTITQLVEHLEQNELGAGELVRQIVLSVPFRNRQLVETVQKKEKP